MNFVSDSVPAPFKISSPFPVLPTSPLFQQARPAIQPKLSLRHKQTLVLSKEVRDSKKIKGTKNSANSLDKKTNKDPLM